VVEKKKSACTSSWSFFPSGEITMACFYVIFTEIFKTQCSAMHLWLFDIRIQVFDKLFIFASRVMLYSLM
jgi:hypothetical protein